jgi:hypothetical protein
MVSENVNSEKDRNEFHARIERYVQNAEKHLRVPAGTIGSTVQDTDFVKIIKMCGAVEPLLRDAVRYAVRKAIDHPKVATSGSEILIKSVGDLPVDRLRKILLEFGTIDERTSDFVEALFTIRHRYAHHISNSLLSILQVCEKIGSEPNGDRRLVAKVAGQEAPPESAARMFLGVLVFYNFSFFLQQVLHLLDPPPSPPGGLLGSVLEQLQREQISKTEV